jgi:uncharacterized metal-binding protein
VPSGQVHNAINTLSYVAIAGAYGYSTSQGLVPHFDVAQIGLFSLSFAAGTFLLSPDLDLAEQNVSSKRNWGLLGFLWVPYGWVFSHRGLSHTWLIGPLTRLFYLALLLAAPVWFARELLHNFRIGQDDALAITVGYYVSQWLHLIADGFSPDMQRGLGLSSSRRRR